MAHGAAAMSLRTVAVLVLQFALGLALTTEALAEASPLPSAVAGDRVRLLVYDQRPIVGRVLALDSLSVELSVEPESTRRAVPWASIVGLEVERLHSRAGRGAAIGFMAGGVTGLVLHPVFDADDTGESATTFVVGAAAGTIVGALIGRASEIRRWSEGALPR
jgi:hypothetical protein